MLNNAAMLHHHYAVADMRGDAQVAFVLEGDTVQQREVTVGRTLGEDREVTQGLSGGETVVLDPSEDLEDDTQVRVAEDADGE